MVTGPPTGLSTLTTRRFALVGTVPAGSDDVTEPGIWPVPPPEPPLVPPVDEPLPAAIENVSDADDIPKSEDPV
jgi:hypothetical protein